MIKKILSGIITVSAVSILYWICCIFIDSHSALKWPHVKGHVLSSTLNIKYSPEFLNFTDDPLRWYGADVKYDYKVDQKIYVSTKVSFHDTDSRNPDTALNIMNKYRRQHDVNVYYNPDNPLEAVLEPGNIGDIFVPLMVSGLLLFLWVVLFLDQSEEINARGVNEYLYRGIKLQKKGDYKEALIEFTKFIEISPRLVQGYRLRGRLYCEVGQWEDAIADFNQAVINDPFDAYMYLDRAKAYLENKQYQQAWVDVQKASDMGLIVSSKIIENIKKGL